MVDGWQTPSTIKMTRGTFFSLLVFFLLFFFFLCWHLSTVHIVGSVESSQSDWKLECWRREQVDYNTPCILNEEHENMSSITVRLKFEWWQREDVFVWPPLISVDTLGPGQSNFEGREKNEQPIFSWQRCLEFRCPKTRVIDISSYNYIFDIRFFSLFFFSTLCHSFCFDKPSGT